MPISFVTTLLILGNILVYAQPYASVRYAAAQDADVQYSTALGFSGYQDTLRMNVWYPLDDDAIARPLAVWVHGGGFTGGNRKDMNATCERWARRGYVAVTVSYRLGFYGPLPLDPPFAYDTAEVIRACYRAVQDCRTALKYLVINAARYKIDTSRVVIGGASAGAITALHAAFVDPSDVVPIAIDSIADVVRGLDRFRRPSLGSLSGTSYLNTPLPSFKAVLNIFGALTDLQLLNGHAFVPVYSYHQRADPVVPCARARGLWGLPFNVSANYNFLYGSCALTSEFARRGIATSQFETWIYEGANHALHDERGIDSAAALFCSRMIQAPVSVFEDNTTDNLTEPFVVIDTRGRIVFSAATPAELSLLANGVYACYSGSVQSVICVVAGEIFHQRLPH